MQITIYHKAVFSHPESFQPDQAVSEDGAPFQLPLHEIGMLGLHLRPRTSTGHGNNTLLSLDHTEFRYASFFIFYDALTERVFSAKVSAFRPVGATDHAFLEGKTVAVVIYRRLRKSYLTQRLYDTLLETVRGSGYDSLQIPASHD